MPEPRIHRTLFGLRARIGLSQVDMAALLKVSAESYRVWESGRRVPPPGLTDIARTAIAARGRALLSMAQLAERLGAHPRTLRAAARDGRRWWSRRAMFDAVVGARARHGDSAGFRRPHSCRGGRPLA